MVDIRRTLTDVQTNLLPDGQAAGSITEQDMRDVVETTGRLPYGGMHTLVAAETTIVTQGVYVKAAGTTQISNLRGFTMPADNQLRYGDGTVQGLIPTHMHIACTISKTSANNNIVSAAKLFFYDDSAGSGAVVDGSLVERFIGTGVDVGSTALHWDLEMHENDYLGLWLANLTDTGNLTLRQFYMFAMGMAM